MKTGRIILNREEETFEAGFCIIKKDLPDLVESISILHPNERTYYDNLKIDKRKKSFLLGRITAKKAIGELVKKEQLQTILIDFGVFQFPVVKYPINQNIQVSISHCDDIGVALAFSEEHPMGIDIERVNPQKMEAMKSQINSNELELAVSHTTSLPLSCAIIWTIKEGLSKILKTGLTMDFKMLEINSFKKDGLIYASTFRHYAQYKALSCHAGHYVCSIILPKNTIADVNLFWNSFRKTATDYF